MRWKLVPLLVLLLWCASLAVALADVPPVLVVFVHGRYEDASGADFVDDDPAWDASVVGFDFPTPLGKKKVFGISDGTYMRKRVRECYWRLAKSNLPAARHDRDHETSLSESVERRVGRANVLYVRYDARNSWYYEPRGAPLVACETRVWLLADALRAVPAKNIVWIAHSNGGLIARAIMSDPQYTDLVGRTREVITLGTPHRGSEMADASVDTDRTREISDALVDLDTTIGAAIRIVGRFSVFDFVAPNLKPWLAQVQAQVVAQAQAEHWNKGDIGRIVRRAKADFLARVYVNELSGRIDYQLTTAFMEATQRPDAEHRLLPAAELPVPFWWVRGSLYPMNPLRMIGGVFQVASWDNNDLTYFVASAGIVTPRLVKRFPDHMEWQHSDGVVSVESAAALGQPLEGNVSGATAYIHHGDLPFFRQVRRLVDRHLQKLMATVPAPVVSPPVAPDPSAPPAPVAPSMPGPDPNAPPAPVEPNKSAPDPSMPQPDPSTPPADPPPP